MKMGEDKDSKNLRLIRRRMILLYSERTIPLVTSFALSLVVGHIVYEKVPTVGLIIWLSLQFLLTVFRLTLLQLFKKLATTEVNFKKWETADVTLTFFSGLNWGLALLFFAKNISPTDYTLILVLVCGMISGAAFSTSASKKVCYSFMLPLFTCLFISILIYTGEDRKYLWVGIIALYMIILLKQVRRLNRDLVEWTLDGLEKEVLLKKVEKEYSYELQLKEEKAKRLESIHRLENAKTTSIEHIARGMAHEIFNPLTILNGKIDVLKKVKCDLIPIDMQKHLGKMENASKRIQQIVEGLVRCADTKIHGKIEEFAINDVLHSIYDINEERLNVKKIQLKKEVGEEKILVKMNKREFTQVIMHLLNNAETAVSASEDRWICIKLESAEQALKISVSDGGPGVRPCHLQHIFTPFFTTKDAGEGPGLGLSIARSIVEKYSGKLQYDDTNKKSEFVISLPLSS